MRNGTYYLNNHGSRWVRLTNGKRDTVTLPVWDGKPATFPAQFGTLKQITRTVIFWESFGNFAVAHINYMGKRISVFPDSVLHPEKPETVTHSQIYHS